MDPRNKVAVVTGGGTGLGKRISLKLAAAGSALAINYSRSEREANETVSEIEAAGGKATAVRADVSSSADVRRMVDAVVDMYGGIDILVGAAGCVDLLGIYRRSLSQDNLNREAFSRTPLAPRFELTHSTYSRCVDDAALIWASPCGSTNP